MKPIQLVLMGLIIFVALAYFSRLRSRLFDRVLVSALIVVGLVMVAAPNSTSVAAHWLGVGRGADLLTYFAIIAIAFSLTMLYSGQRKLEAQITELARAIALQNARIPANVTSKTPARSHPRR